MNFDRAQVASSGRTLPAVVLGLIALTCAACTSGRQPAQQALSEILGVVDQSSPDLARYLPARAAIIRRRVKSLQASFDAEDYSAVLADSPALLADARELVAQAAEKRSQAAKVLMLEWTTLDEAMPRLIAAARLRIEASSKTKSWRDGADIARAETNIATSNGLWDEAESAFESGKLDDALALIKDAKSSVEATATPL